jgi:hypothetical protein
LRVRRLPEYHAWVHETPVIDVVVCVVAFASVVIGAHAGLYFILGAAAGRWDIALAAAQFFVYIAIANVVVDVWRHWYRHHG